MAQSIQGLSFLANEEGESDVAVWMDEGNNYPAYTNNRSAFEAMGIKEIGKRTALELATMQPNPGDDLVEIWTGNDGKPNHLLD